MALCMPKNLVFLSCSFMTKSWDINKNLEFKIFFRLVLPIFTITLRPSWVKHSGSFFHNKFLSKRLIWRWEVLEGHVCQSFLFPVALATISLWGLVLQNSDSLISLGNIMQRKLAQYVFYWIPSVAQCFKVFVNKVAE